MTTTDAHGQAVILGGFGTASTDEMGSVIFNCVAARESETPALRQAIRLQLLDLIGKGFEIK